MRFQNRALKPNPNNKDWFRIENAHVDTDTSNEDLTKIYIYDVIGDSFWEDATSAADFVKQISTIKSKTIELHLNSPGGDIFDGVSIHNALKAHSAYIRTVIDGLAASAASFIAMAGDEVIITKAGTMMIHDASSFAFGNAADMRATADVLDKLSDTVASIYSDRAGQTVEFWRNLMVEETWYNSSEAVEVGLADKVGGDTKKEDNPENLWDLSIFNHAGRGEAPDPLAVRTRIANRLKETTVTRVVNSEDQTEGTEQPNENDKNPSSPSVNPDAETTDGNATEVQEDREDQAGSPDATPDSTGGSGVEARTNFKPSNVAGVVQFRVNDQVVSDPSAIQRHIDMLEGFRREANEESRKSFVVSLSNENKILASQVTSMTEYALSLDDEGFAAWAKLYNASPALPMLSGGYTHEQTDSNGGPSSQNSKEIADRIEVLKGIVRQHLLRGTPEDKVKANKSYKELKNHLPDFELSELDPTFKR
jgi:ATP-dependent protease ClpP protease subunit